MSLKTEYRTEIIIPKVQQPQPDPVTGELNIKGSPSLKILRRALEKVVQDHGGTITDTYSDCEGTEHKCLLAIRTGDFQRGIGVDIEEDGRVTFIYDAATLVEATPQEYVGQARYILDKTEVAEAICAEIAQNYAVLAVIEAQRRAGLQIQVQQSPTPQGRQVIVTGTGRGR